MMQTWDPQTQGIPPVGGDTAVVPSGTLVGTHRGRYRWSELKSMDWCVQTFAVEVDHVEGDTAFWMGSHRNMRSASRTDLWTVDPSPPEGFRTCRWCRKLLPDAVFTASELAMKSRTYLSMCQPCTRIRHKVRQDAKSKSFNRRQKYNLDDTTYFKMLESQGSACAICGLLEKDNRTGRALNVDHDHKTMKVRGLLCTSCNLALGYLNDDIALLDVAKAYLVRHSS